MNKAKAGATLVTVMLHPPTFAIPSALASAFLVMGGACSAVKSSPDAGVDLDAAPAADAATVDAEPSTYTVGGTVSGFAGRNLVLHLNGAEELEITADGSFTFTTGLSNAAAFTVGLISEPICPQRFCTLGNEVGTLAGANVTNITLTCAEPLYRFASHSWGDDAVRVVDDIASIADNATATPRILTGNLTDLGQASTDTISIDSGRDLLYAPVGASLDVWENASTVEGNVAPTRSISIAAETQIGSVEVDEARDRVYITGNTNLYVLDNASTLNGVVVPTATIALNSAESISLDRINDRLYVGGDYSEEVFVFDGASALTSASTPDRTIVWDAGSTGFNGPPGVVIDGCRDRLYLGSNSNSPSGYNLVAFDNASTLTGAVNLETDSQAQYDNNGCISLALDTSGKLYCWPDSPTEVSIFNTPETWSGVVTPTIDKTILGVVNRGYGMDVVAY